MLSRGCGQPVQADERSSSSRWRLPSSPRSRIPTRAEHRQASASGAEGLGFRGKGLGEQILHGRLATRTLDVARLFDLQSWNLPESMETCSCTASLLQKLYKEDLGVTSCVLCWLRKSHLHTIFHLLYKKRQVFPDLRASMAPVGMHMKRAHRRFESLMQPERCQKNRCCF